MEHWLAAVLPSLPRELSPRRPRSKSSWFAPPSPSHPKMRCLEGLARLHRWLQCCDGLFGAVALKGLRGTVPVGLRILPEADSIPALIPQPWKRARDHCMRVRGTRGDLGRNDSRTVAVLSKQNSCHRKTASHTRKCEGLTPWETVVS